MTKTYCDWCKKEIGTSKDVLVKVAVYREHPFLYEHWDLCDDCYQVMKNNMKLISR